MSNEPQAFTLLCHPADQHSPALTLRGSIARRQDARLQIEYQLHGDLDLLDIPTATGPPRRRDQLWQRTCFELFIAMPGESGYWEFNLSPSGDWNCYQFSVYRKQMTREDSIQSLALVTQQHNGSLSLSAELPLPTQLAAHSALPVGISAVIRKASGNCSYWALTHPADQADFHHPGGFALRL